MRRSCPTALSDAAWVVLAPFLDRPGLRGLPRPVDPREAWDATTVVLGAGCRRLRAGGEERAWATAAWVQAAGVQAAGVRLMAKRLAKAR